MTQEQRLGGLFVCTEGEQFAAKFLADMLVVLFAWQEGHLPFEDVAHLEGRVEGGLGVRDFYSGVVPHLEEMCWLEDHAEGVVVLDHDTFKDDGVEEEL